MTPHEFTFDELRAALEERDKEIERLKAELEMLKDKRGGLFLAGTSATDMQEL
jgi:hypothetical protein